MIELFQFPWSTFCIVQNRILSFSGTPFQAVPVSSTDRSLVWELTKQRYYSLPVLRDGRDVLFETDEDSQVLAKYLDSKLHLGLFPREWEGVQTIMWMQIESRVEGPCFKLNDIHWQEFVPKEEQLPFLRHKERKFGRGCIDSWKSGQKALLTALEHELVPFELMLSGRDYLLDERPRFVDFDLFGMLENFLYSGHYKLPRRHTRLAKWHERMKSVQHNSLPA